MFLMFTYLLGPASCSVSAVSTGPIFVLLKYGSKCVPFFIKNKIPEDAKYKTKEKTLSKSKIRTETPPQKCN